MIIGQDEIEIYPHGAKIFIDKAGSEDKTLKIYKGFYHEVFNEPEKNKVLRDIETWLNRQMEPQKDRVKTLKHKYYRQREDGSGKMAAGRWQREDGSGKMAAGRWQREDGSGKMAAGRWQRETDGNEN